MFWFAVNDVLWVYVIRVILLGYAMYAVLGPGHFPEDAVCLNKSVDRADFVLLQAATAIDFRVGIIGSFICSGLQYQVEHHLFPSISHVFYPEISALIREFCERRGVPYRSFGWGEALWKSWIVLRHPHHVERHLARMPQNANPVQLDYAAD
jgi:fatty acid desaturase